MPVSSNVNVKDALFLIRLLSNTDVGPSDKLPLDAVCVAMSRLIHFMVSPTLIVILVGK